MNIFDRVAVGILGLSFLLVTTPYPTPVHATPKSMDKIRINIFNNSTFDHKYTMRDPVCTPRCCDKDPWITPVAAGKTARIGLCSDHTLHDGYAEFYYHDEEHSVWTHKTLLRDGYSVSL
jgi:hypothetical protein